MDVSKSLIAMSVSAALMGGVWESAVAKKSDEEDSVYRWGRWAVLSPAAGQEEVIAFAPAGGNDLGRCDSAANCPDPNKPEEPEEPEYKPRVVSYVRIDYLPRGEAPRHYVGGIGFVVDATGQNLGFKVTGPNLAGDATVELDSDMLPVEQGADGFRTRGGRGIYSRINGTLTDGVDNVALIEGFDPAATVEGSWYHNAAGVPGMITQGEYVMGMTASGAQMATLMDALDIGLGGDIFAQYSGPTANGGSIDLTFNLSDSEGRWTGEVHGTVLDFQAGGTLNNAEFVADHFSDNISDGAMQGALVNAGHNAIGSFVVESDMGEGGLLREADIFNAGLTSGTPTLEQAAQ